MRSKQMGWATTALFSSSDMDRSIVGLGKGRSTLREAGPVVVHVADDQKKAVICIEKDPVVTFTSVIEDIDHV